MDHNLGSLLYIRMFYLHGGIEIQKKKKGCLQSFTTIIHLDQDQDIVKYFIISQFHPAATWLIQSRREHYQLRRENSMTLQSLENFVIKGPLLLFCSIKSGCSRISNICPRTLKCLGFTILLGSKSMT